MRARGQTIIEIAATATAILATLLFGYWLMRAHLGLSQDFAAVVVAATTVLILPTALYGYYTGWVQHRNGETPEGLARLWWFKRRFRVAVFLSLIGLPLILALLNLLIARNVAGAALCLVIALLVAPWALRKIRVDRLPAP